MQITITKAMLEEHDACSNGVEAFVEMFGESGTVDWTRDKQVEMLQSPLKGYLVWAYRESLIPWWSMQFADLQFANLQSADLQFADLRSANLQFANLQFANLQSAIPNTLYAELFASFGWAIVDGKLQKADAPKPVEAESCE